MGRRDFPNDSEDDWPTGEERRVSAFSFSSNASPCDHNARPAGASAPPRILVAAYAANILLSTLSTRQLDSLAREFRFSTWALPLAHFAVLSAVALVAGCSRHSLQVGAAVRREAAGFPDGGSAKVACAAGAASALSMVLRFYEMRTGEQQVYEALEVFSLPLLLALLPYASAKLDLGNGPLPHPSAAFLAACTVSVGLLGFALIGVTAGSADLALALLRLPLETSSLVLLKAGVGGRGGDLRFLRTVFLSGLLVALFALPPALLNPSTTPEPSTKSAKAISFSSGLLLSVSAQITSLVTLSTFSNPVTTIASLFPRNFLLLVGSTIGAARGLPLRDNWVQIAAVYASGSLATVWTDLEVLDALRCAVNGGESGDTLRLEEDDASSSPPTPSSLFHSSPLLVLLPFLPFSIFLLTAPTTPSSLSFAYSYLPPSLQSSTVCSTLPTGLTSRLIDTSLSTSHPQSSLAAELLADHLAPTAHTVDLVVSYYDELLARTKAHVDHIRGTEFVRRRSSRVVVYNKGPRGEEEIRAGLGLEETDEVVPLPNLGREGATYLKHILLHYNATVSPPVISNTTGAANAASPTSLASASASLRVHTLADHTYFLQPHLAWENVALPRLDLVRPDTGFAHLGPYVKSECGYDARVRVDFPMLKELYNMFTGRICPPEGHLAAWSGQMVVSKRRILANPYAKYAMVDELMEAPEGHWIHHQWAPNDANSPSNPAFGHSLERAWPVVFGCADVEIVESCPDDLATGEATAERCQCLDS
ncbi:hypothetical protein JCM6882_003859 [Rhodosporidiobolus microsporus]